eukprot:6293879-Amphidinium_carterae.1
MTGSMCLVTGDDVYQTELEALAWHTCPWRVQNWRSPHLGRDVASPHTSASALLMCRCARTRGFPASGDSAVIL